MIHQVNKHGVSGRWFTEADVRNFKSGALRTTTNITRTMFKLSVSCMISKCNQFFHYRGSNSIM